MSKIEDENYYNAYIVESDAGRIDFKLYHTANDLRNGDSVNVATTSFYSCNNIVPFDDDDTIYISEEDCSLIVDKLKCSGDVNLYRNKFGDLFLECSRCCHEEYFYILRHPIDQ